MHVGTAERKPHGCRADWPDLHFLLEATMLVLAGHEQRVLRT